MKKLITALCLMATIASAQDSYLRVWYKAEAWTNDYNALADIKIDIYKDQYYPPQPTNTFYPLWTNDITGEVSTNIWREETRPMNQQEKRNLIMTGWKPLYEIPGTETNEPQNLIAYEFVRIENPFTSIKDLKNLTDIKISQYKQTLTAKKQDYNIIFIKE